MKKNHIYFPKNITLHALSTSHRKGFLKIGQRYIPCALGKSGRKYNKKEGDGASPRGKWGFIGVLYRADKISRPHCFLKGKSIAKQDIWCDDPTSSLYNCLTKKPFKKNAEDLWRSDNQYDLVIIIDYNLSPCIKYQGSAIFMHIVKDESYSGTEGCIAFKKSDFLKILRQIGPKTKLWI